MVDLYVIADIGGTNSNFALFDKDKNKILYNKKYMTNDYLDVYEIINDFINIVIEKHKSLPYKAVLAIAGIIDEKHTLLTNSKLIIDKSIISKKTSLKEISFVNDFIAVAYSVNEASFNDCIVVQKNSSPYQPQLFMGAGTGFGKAVKVKDIVLESEAGHSSFPIQDKNDFELVEFAKKKLEKKIIETEDILSGKGIEIIYEFLSKSHKQSYVISSDVEKDKFAKKTFKLFYKYYARTCRNFALDMLCSEIFLSGGIIQKNDFSHKDFIREFTDNKTHKAYLESVGINIIKNSDMHLLGIGNMIYTDKKKF